jgi:hypothetical protein
VWGEYDSPGCSVREIAVQGTHKAEWCGVAGSGRRVKFHVCVLFLFGKDDTSGELLAERIYFDNETVLKSDEFSALLIDARGLWPIAR